MKNKKLLILVLAVFMISFVLGVDSPDAGIGSEDVEAIENLTNKIPIDPDTGKFDPGKLFGESNAEVRIRAMNMWLEENATWLKAVFGMVPSVTLLFAFVFYFWLFFLAQALNGVAGEVIYDIVYAFKEVRGDPTETLDLIPLSIAQIIGLVLFGFFIIFKMPLAFGTFSYNSLIGIWRYGWIGVLIIIIVFAVVAIKFPQATKVILLMIKKRREQKAETNKAIDQQVLHETVKGITGE